MCGLGAVSTSLAFGLVRGAGAFAAVLPPFALISRMTVAEHNHDFGHFFSATSPSRRETMVDSALERTSAFRVDLGVGAAVIAPGFRACPSRSCDGWVFCLGVVGTSLVFGLVRGSGVFTEVFPSFALVSRMPFAQHNHGFGHFFSTTSSSRRETMVVSALTRVSTFRVGLGVSGVSRLVALPTS